MDAKEITAKMNQELLGLTMTGDDARKAIMNLYGNTYFRTKVMNDVTIVKKVDKSTYEFTLEPVYYKRIEQYLNYAISMARKNADKYNNKKEKPVIEEFDWGQWAELSRDEFIKMATERYDKEVLNREIEEAIKLLSNNGYKVTKL